MSMGNSDASAENEPRRARADEESVPRQSLSDPDAPGVGQLSPGELAGQLAPGGKGGAHMSSLAQNVPRHRASGSGQADRGSLSPDLYQIAYEASQRALDDQQDELGRLRDRSVNFAAFVGATTGFLVGTGLQASHRDAVFYVLAGVASACSFGFIWMLFFLLNPSTKNKWRAGISAEILINEWIEVDIPPTEAQLERELALSYDTARGKNEVLLSSLRSCYRWLIMSGSAQVTLWAGLVWFKR